MREAVEFTPNVPVQVALAYKEGKIVEGRFGQRVMFTLADGRVMFLDLDVAQKINELEPKPRQPFFVRKEFSGKKGDLAHWRVWLSPDPSVGEQPDGTFVVPSSQPGAGVSPAAPASPAPVSNPAPTVNHNGNGNTNGNSKPPAELNIHQGWAQFLLAQTNALVDVYAAALNYASQKHGNQVKADDVRSLLTTAYISQCKNGGGPNIA
jgi:hypothetical protein